MEEVITALQADDLRPKILSAFLLEVLHKVLDLHKACKLINVSVDDEDGMLKAPALPQHCTRLEKEVGHHSCCTVKSNVNHSREE